MQKEIGIGYQLGKTYFRLAINGIFYRRYYCLGKENIPAEGTPVLVAMNVLVLLPLSFILTWLVTGLCAGFWVGLVHALLIGPLCIFEWYYAKLWRDTWRDIRFLRKDTTSLAALREQALSSLKTV